MSLWWLHLCRAEEYKQPVDCIIICVLWFSCQPNYCSYPDLTLHFPSFLLDYLAPPFFSPTQPPPIKLFGISFHFSNKFTFILFWPWKAIEIDIDRKLCLQPGLPWYNNFAPTPLEYVFAFDGEGDGIMLSFTKLRNSIFPSLFVNATQLLTPVYGYCFSFLWSLSECHHIDKILWHFFLIIFYYRIFC